MNWHLGSESANHKKPEKVLETKPNCGYLIGRGRIRPPLPATKEDALKMNYNEEINGKVMFRVFLSCGCTNTLCSRVVALRSFRGLCRGLFYVAQYYFCEVTVVRLRLCIVVDAFHKILKIPLYFSFERIPRFSSAPFEPSFGLVCFVEKPESPDRRSACV